MRQIEGKLRENWERAEAKQAKSGASTEKKWVKTELIVY